MKKCDRTACPNDARWHPVIHMKPAMHAGKPYNGPPITMFTSLGLCDLHREMFSISDVTDSGLWDQALRYIRARKLAEPSKHCTTISFKLIGDLKELGGRFANV